MYIDGLDILKWPLELAAVSAQVTSPLEGVIGVDLVHWWVIWDFFHPSTSLSYLFIQVGESFVSWLVDLEVLH